MCLRGKFSIEGWVLKGLESKVLKGVVLKRGRSQKMWVWNGLESILDRGWFGKRQARRGLLKEIGLDTRVWKGVSQEVWPYVAAAALTQGHNMFPPPTLKWVCLCVQWCAQNELSHMSRISWSRVRAHISQKGMCKGDPRKGVTLKEYTRSRFWRIEIQFHIHL